MKIFNPIREFFWPLLEKVHIPDLDVVKTEHIIPNDKEHLKYILEQTLKRYEAEEDRKRVVESKSALFIGTTSIITTILVAVSTIFINNQTKLSVGIFTMILLLFLLTLYMARTIWFSIQALERKRYHALSPQDFYEDVSSDYYKKMIVKVHNMIQNNYKAINSKVDSMVMAQEYFKRAIIVIATYPLVLLIFVLSGSINWENLSHFVSRIDVNFWHYFILNLLVTIALVLSIIANIRIKRKK